MRNAGQAVKNNKSKDIHRSKDNCTGVTEGQAGRQSVNSVLQSGHFGDIGHLGDLDYSGDLDDHVDEHADLVHAVGHGQEDDGSKREVEEKGRPACRLHLRTRAKYFFYFFCAQERSEGFGFDFEDLLLKSTLQLILRPSIQLHIKCKAIHEL